MASPTAPKESSYSADRVTPLDSEISSFAQISNCALLCCALCKVLLPEPGQLGSAVDTGVLDKEGTA